MFLGSFTSQNNFVTNKFATQFIPGNTVVVEYYEPNQVEFESQIHISSIVHVFTDLKMGVFSPEGACSLNRNASCPEGYAWARERKSVAMVLMEINTDVAKLKYNPRSNYWGIGSGALINNVLQDGSPFFLTANHLYDLKDMFPYFLERSEPLNWLFLFNHESSSCAEIS